jgi:hypothetical protein
MNEYIRNDEVEENMHSFSTKDKIMMSETTYSFRFAFVLVLTLLDVSIKNQIIFNIQLKTKTKEHM